MKKVPMELKGLYISLECQKEKRGRKEQKAYVKK